MSTPQYTTLILTEEQRKQIEALWTPEVGTSIPHYTELMVDALVRAASQDLRWARNHDEHIVGDTLRGTLTLRYRREVKQYTIGSPEGMLYFGNRHGALKTLVNAYKIEAPK